MKRTVSIGTKLTGAIFLVLSLFTALVYVGLSRFEKNKLISAKEQGARMAGELFLRSVMAPVLFEDETGIKDAAALLAQDPEVIGVQLWKVDGRRPGPLITAQLKGEGERGVAPLFVDVGTIDRRRDRIILRDAVRDHDHKAIALVAVQYSLEREHRAFLELRRRILGWAAGAGTLLSLLLWGGTRRWITQPLARLLRAVRQLEAGERVELQRVRSYDEVGRLAEAFTRMAEAVDRRERDVVRRNNDMKLIMDNVAEGLLSVQRDGTLLPEHSAVVESWLGPWPPAETTFPGYLKSNAPKTAAWLEVLWDNVSADIFPLDVALGQLPERLEIGPRVFQVLYKPIQRGEELNILIVLSDVSAQVEQERTKLGQQELINIFQWMVKDRAGLEEFFADAERLVRSISAEGPRDLVQLKRDVHTLKGNSGIFGLSSVVTACQAAEERFAEGCESLPAREREDLWMAWQRVGERRRQLLGDDTRRCIEVEPAEHQALIEALQGDAPRAEIVAQVRAWSQEPARQRLGRIGEQARQLARRMGKGEITVQVEANNLRLPEGRLREFWYNFAHLLRNAIDHGLETPEERLRIGKSAAGSIQLRTTVVGERFLVEIEDDGRGIDWVRLRARACATGLPYETRDDLVEALFADGISTRAEVSETSGRGVGMSAVRGACERTGGKVRVYSEPGAGTRFQFSWPVAILRGDGVL